MNTEHSRRPTRPRRVWASLAIFAAVMIYAIVQPRLNQQLGWDLPGLFDSPATPDAPQNSPTPSAKAPATTQSPASADAASSAAAPADPPAAEMQLGQLRDVGGQVKMSAAGLLYTPGSAEGHRLDHVLRHSRDDPDRPGSHGVFDGGREGALAVIDEAYLLTQHGGAAVKTERDGNRIVYTVNMGRTIGYIGGSVGRRDKNPPARRIRLVLEGDKVVTAYPMK